MDRADKESLAFGIILLTVLFSAIAVVAVKEYQRNAACAELGGIVVNLKCGRFIEIKQEPTP